MRSPFGPVAPLLALLLAGAACSSDPVLTAPDAPSPDVAGDDATGDAPADDVAEDVVDAAPDRAADAASDHPADAAPDRALDAPEDAPDDVAPDATPDAAPDAALDVAPDRAPDVSIDAAPDAAPDVAPDRAPDVAPDVAADAPADVAVDAGVCAAPRRLCGAPAVCVDPRSDAENCGACGTRCPAGRACSAGACVTVTALEGGAEHTCAVLGDRTVVCWGHDEFGQVGDGAIGRLTVRARPTPVAGLTDVVALAAGRAHNCVIRAGGAVSCWGANASGQAGSGAYSDGEARAVTVAGVTGATALAAGWSHTCAIVAGGEVRCWGSNAIGQLGNGSTVGSSLTPVAVSGITGATSIAAGHFFTCAILADRTTRCWGSNGNGQLGAMTPTTTSRVPVTVASDLQNPQRVFAGSTFACVTSADGHIRCWGEGRSGQFGNGMLTASATASLVALTGPFVGTALGDDFACTASGLGYRCWGNNNNGQLATGTFSLGAEPTPVAPSGLTGVSSFAAGAAHGCALLADGRATCWGGGSYGQLGDGGALGVPDPQAVAGLTGVAQVVARDHHTCVRMSDRTVRCTGRAYAGLFGDGSTAVARFAFGPVTGLANVAELAGGSFHTCARLADGTVRCWGDNRDGQCGDGTTTTAAAPVAVTGLTGVTQLALGQTFSCALLANGTVRCWGGNGGGTLGRGYTDLFSHSVPEAPVLTVTGATAVAAGLFNACAIVAGGALRCWGGNSQGEVGDGTTTGRYTPVAVPGVTNVTKVVGGYQHTCALRGDGVVLCWGLNQSGQCGAPTATRNVLTPTPVPGVTDAVDVVAGEFFTCARRRDGSTWCWGANDAWQLGGGEVFVARPTPEAVRGLPAVTDLSAGAQHACALVDGALRCWGAHTAGEHGNGHLFPVRF
ncbi:MAG: hypothetical protein U0324_18105 [Polyangiales bacterium]